MGRPTLRDALHRNARRQAAACVAAWAALVPGAAMPALAQGALADPTRPPAVAVPSPATTRLLVPAAASPGPGALPRPGLSTTPSTSPSGTPSATPATAPAALPPPAPPAPPPPPVLQSVQLGTGGSASTALVDGRLVRVGDRLGDALVLVIDLQGLLLQGPHGPQRLTLLSGRIVKTPSAATPALAGTPPPGTPPQPARAPLAAAGDRP